jgi:hypothetical protein
MNKAHPLKLLFFVLAGHSLDVNKVALRERDARTFNCNIGAGSHCEADIGVGDELRGCRIIAGQHDDAQALFAQRLDGCDKCKKRVLVHVANRFDGNQLGLAFGQCSSLVDDQSIDFLKRLQGFGVLYQHTSMCAVMGGMMCCFCSLMRLHSL